jgi:hypothetical protein
VYSFDKDTLWQKMLPEMKKGHLSATNGPFVLSQFCN